MTSIQAKQAILTACTYSESGTTVDLDRIRGTIGMSKNAFYLRKGQHNDSIDSYRLVEGSHRKTKWGLLQRKCVLDFCHSEDSLSIDSNSRKIIDVNGKKHVGRVWLAKTINEQYKMFLTSEIVEDNLRQEPGFVVPSVSFYYHN